MKAKELFEYIKAIKNTIQTITLAVFLTLILLVGISLYFQPSFMKLDPNKFNSFIEYSTSKYNMNRVGEIISPEQVEEIAIKINKTCNENCPYNEEVCGTEMCYIYEVNYIMQDFTYVNDMEKYIYRDYWQSPAVTLAFGLEGDCEDSAIFQDSILQNLMNYTYLIHSKEHIYNLACVNKTPVVMDYEGLYIGDEAIKRIKDMPPINYYNYREKKWSKDFDMIYC